MSLPSYWNARSPTPPIANALHIQWLLRMKLKKKVNVQVKVSVFKFVFYLVLFFKDNIYQSVMLFPIYWDRESKIHSIFFTYSDSDWDRIGGVAYKMDWAQLAPPSIIKLWEITLKSNVSDVLIRGVIECIRMYTSCTLWII